MGKRSNIKKMVVGDLEVEGSIVRIGTGVAYDRLSILCSKFNVLIFDNNISIHPRDKTSITVFDSRKITIESKEQQYTKKEGEPEYLTFRIVEIQATRRD